MLRMLSRGDLKTFREFVELRPSIHRTIYWDTVFSKKWNIASIFELKSSVSTFKLKKNTKSFT